MSLKELAEVLGYEVKDEKDFKIEDFKTHVDKTYVTRENVLKDDDVRSKIESKVYGEVYRKVAKIFDLTSDEIKDKKIDDILVTAKGKVDVKLTELTEKVGKNTDERIAAAEREREKEKQRADDLQLGLTTKEGEWTEKEKAYNGRVRGLTLGHKFEKAKEKVLFIDDFAKNEIVRTGFETVLNNKYGFDIDEKGEVAITTKADGKQVFNPKKSGQPITLEELLTLEADNAKLLKKNNTPSDKTPVRKVAPDANEKPPVNKVHPNAVRHAEELNA